MPLPDQCDPRTRKETWLFQELRDPTNRKRKVLNRLRFNLVEYDGIAEQLVEPVSAGEQLDTFAASTGLTNPHPSNGVGRIAGFLIFDTPPFDGVQRFD